MATERPMSNGVESGRQALAARALLARRLHGVLSTLSAEMPGYPFGSVTPYCLDASGAPVLLVSHLSQHTRNLLEEPRAALTVVDDVAGDVQEAARLTAVGRVEPLAGEDRVAERYFRYFPQTRFYHEALNFRFFGLRPERWHWNGGFATARWFGNDRILAPSPFPADVESSVVAHMEADHRDALARYARMAGLDPSAEDEIRLCGVDGEGLDVGVGGRIVRICFPRPVTTPGELRDLLVELARSSDP